MVLTLLASSMFGCRRDEKAHAMSPTRVVVAPVRESEVRLYSETVAELRGFVDAEIRARVAGYLRKQLYRDGSQVSAGQVLFEIDPAEYRAALESARAAEARARAAAQLGHAQLERAQSLVRSGGVAQSEFDDAVARDQDAQGQVRAAHAAVSQAELNLGYTELRSPVAGMAGIALVRVGNLVGKDGPTLLTTVSQLDPMRVRFPISERDYLRNAARYRALSEHDMDWAKAQLQQLEQTGVADDPSALELILADGRAYDHPGLIVATDREINANTGTMQVEALFANPDGLLRPGQYGRVKMRVDESDRPSLVVPQKALIEVQGTYSLAVVGNGDKVQLRRVEVGPSTETERVIQKGVKTGELVVVEGVQKVHDGDRVISTRAPAAQGSSAQAAKELP